MATLTASIEELDSILAGGPGSGRKKGSKNKTTKKPGQKTSTKKKTTTKKPGQKTSTKKKTTKRNEEGPSPGRGGVRKKPANGTTKITPEMNRILRRPEGYNRPLTKFEKFQLRRRGLL